MKFTTFRADTMIIYLDPIHLEAFSAVGRGLPHRDVENTAAITTAEMRVPIPWEVEVRAFVFNPKKVDSSRIRQGFQGVIYRCQRH